MHYPKARVNCSAVVHLTLGIAAKTIHPSIFFSSFLTFPPSSFIVPLPFPLLFLWRHIDSFSLLVSPCRSKRKKELTWSRMTEQESLSRPCNWEYWKTLLPRGEANRFGGLGLVSLPTTHRNGVIAPFPLSSVKIWMLLNRWQIRTRTRQLRRREALRMKRKIADKMDLKKGVCGNRVAAPKGISAKEREGGSDGEICVWQWLIRAAACVVYLFECYSFIQVMANLVGILADGWLVPETDRLPMIQCARNPIGQPWKIKLVTKPSSPCPPGYGWYVLRVVGWASLFLYSSKSHPFNSKRKE